MTRNVLLISPYFPPRNVIGSKRAINFTRHLPEHGWQPIVLSTPTVHESEDPDLVELVPPSTPVSFDYVSAFRARARQKRQQQPPKPKAGGKPKKKPHPAWLTRLGLGPAQVQYLTPFDRFIVDVPAGIRAGLRLIKKHRVEAILVNADPWSPFITSAVLKKLTGVPVVLDLRDPWSLHEHKATLRTRPSTAVLRTFERFFFDYADRVVLNTEQCRDAHIAWFDGRIPAERFDFLRNAFDRGIYRRIDEEPAPSKTFTVLYFGSLRLQVGGEPVLRGFRRFVDRLGLAPGDARLVFMGKARPIEHELVQRLELEDRVGFEPPISIRDAMPVLKRAHALLMINPTGYRLTLPGKLYDYFAAERPILALTDNPELQNILRDTRAGVWTSYAEPDVEGVLEKLYTDWQEERPWEPDVAQVERFSASFQASRMAEILNGVIR